MQTEDVKYSGCLIRPVVTTAENGRLCPRPARERQQPRSGKRQWRTAIR
jgi:hypothetical protein